MIPIPNPEQIEKMYPYIIHIDTEKGIHTYDPCCTQKREAYTAALELVKERDEEIIRLKEMLKWYESFANNLIGDDKPNI